MDSSIKLEHVLFLDIETVPQESHFNLISEEMQLLFADKTKYQRKEEISVEDFYDRAGIWAEFGKIVCISIGYFVPQKDNIRQFRITSLIGKEVKILTDFKSIIETHFNKSYHLLCAHNGKEFDFPYIARRMLISGIALPEKLNLFRKKPWEVNHLDTLELWKFGDYKHYTSLKLLTTILGIPSPKDDIDGSQVKTVFYEEKNITRISQYCEKDTLAVAQIILKFKQQPLLQPNEITFI